MKFTFYKKLLVLCFFSSYLNTINQQFQYPKQQVVYNQQTRPIQQQAIYKQQYQPIQQIQSSLQNKQQLQVKYIPIQIPNNMVLSMIAVGSSNKNIWGVAKLKVVQQGAYNSYIVKKRGKQWTPVIAGKHVSVGKDNTVVILDHQGNVYRLRKNKKWKALSGVRLSKLGVASKDLMWGSVQDSHGIYHVFVYHSGRWHRAKNYENENATGLKNFSFSNDGKKLFAVDDLGKVFKYTYKQATEIKNINKNTGVRKNLNKARKRRLKKLLNKIKKLKKVKNKTKRQIKKIKKLKKRFERLKKKLKRASKSKKSKKGKKKKVNKNKIRKKIQKIQKKIAKLNKIQNKTPKQNKQLIKLNQLLEKYNKKIKSN